jgi:hypothetical protein
MTLVLASPEDGRIGDVWRIRGLDDHEMTVTRLSRPYTITLNSISEPQPSGWGYDLNDWDNVLYRIRENLDDVQVGDVVHLYVPPTEVYLLDVKIDSRYPALSGWFGYQVGRPPEPDVEDSGLFFHPSADQMFDAERLHRPFEMLEEGTVVRDTDGGSWKFLAPFFFIGEDGARGEPEWPLEVPGDSGASARLRATSRQEQMSVWADRSGVDPSVFDQAWNT